MGKYMTHEDFLIKLCNVHGNKLVSIDTYIGSHTKIRFGCDNNHIWLATPHDILRLKGCPHCGRRSTFTNVEFLQKLYARHNGTITTEDKYVNSSTKLKFKCSNNHTWYMAPTEILTRKGCPSCNCKKAQIKTKKTHEGFCKEVWDLVRDEYTVEGIYVNTATKIKMRHNCSDCNYTEFEPTPNNFLSKGSRCPKCDETQRWKSHSQFQEEVFKLVKNEYIVLGEYKNASTRIKFKHNCTDCDNYEFEMAPKHFLDSQKCPKCYREVQRMKKHQKFIDAFFKSGAIDYDIIGEYPYPSNTFIFRHNCDKCNNYEFEMTSYAFLAGQRCPECKPYKGENRIKHWCKSNSLSFKPQYTFPDCKDKLLLRFDVGVLNKDGTLSCLIEYDGQQHFRPVYFGGISKERGLINFVDIQKKDRIKNEYCLTNNIKLLRISYWDFKNIEKILEREVYNGEI